MAITIVKVESRKQLKLFVTFPLKLYKDCENWVPALEGDEYDTFNPEKNGAYDFCEADCFLAYRGDEIVGRVAAIINHKADDAQKLVRFGWLDFIEDMEVLKALINTVAEWGKQRGRLEMRGPWGFTDMDKEGLLIEGYENLSPFTCLYNFPYYGTMLEQLGFEKDVDWTQRVLLLDHEMPPTYKFAHLIEERYGIHVVQPKSMKQMCKQYGMEIFHMYNEAFAPLMGFSPLTDKQIANYLDTYVPILDKDFVAVAVDSKDKPIGFLFCVPSLSKAVKKSNGRLFPFGFIRILKALKKNDTLEALIIGVSPEHQQKGVPLLMFKYLHENCIKRGIERVIMNPQLEENYKVQSLFGEYKTIPFMRRRAYKKGI
jgi:GNAT superfamily N-acetyltransferase